jgi:hypothetical protein
MKRGVYCSRDSTNDTLMTRSHVLLFFIHPCHFAALVLPTPNVSLSSFTKKRNVKYDISLHHQYNPSPPPPPRTLQSSRIHTYMPWHCQDPFVRRSFCTSVNTYLNLHHSSEIHVYKKPTWHQENILSWKRGFIFRCKSFLNASRDSCEVGLWIRRTIFVACPLRNKSEHRLSFLRCNFWGKLIAYK